jgi:hypothetical protein
MPRGQRSHRSFMTFTILLPSGERVEFRFHLPVHDEALVETYSWWPSGELHEYGKTTITRFIEDARRIQQELRS